MRRGVMCAALGIGLLLAPAAFPADETLTHPPLRPLNLGLYGRVYPASQALQMPRFESSIEVIGERPLDYNDTMAVFWRQWDLSTGSLYGKGVAFHNQGCATCVNILPLIDKLIDKIKK
jgi:hypothetical protein